MLKKEARGFSLALSISTIRLGGNNLNLITRVSVAAKPQQGQGA